MCGRFVRKTPLIEAARIIDIRDSSAELPLSHNISPGQDICVLTHETELKWNIQRWGFVPNWGNLVPKYRQTINIRVETLANRNFFNESLRQRRCLILADGFYEWMLTSNGKLPFYFHLKQNTPFFFAGIWNYSDHKGELLPSCAILTVNANELVKPLHERMPAILSLQNFRKWLDWDSHDKQDILNHLTSFPGTEMECYRVSTKVNSNSCDSPDCIQNISSESVRKYEQLKLF